MDEELMFRSTWKWPRDQLGSFPQDPEPPFVQRGDFFQTPERGEFRARGYHFPLEFNAGKRRCFTFCPGAYLGPVHKFHDCSTYRAVLVPVFRTTNEGVEKAELFWVNVFNFETKTHYAHRIEWSDVSKWYACGWRPEFAPAWYEMQRTPANAAPWRNTAEGT